ncbi:MAG: iron-sulfur cluster assembly protein, partial [Mycobacterium sp.]
MSETHDDTAGLHDKVYAALGTVLDPDIRRPLTELGMVKSIE